MLPFISGNLITKGFAIHVDSYPRKILNLLYIFVFTFYDLLLRLFIKIIYINRSIQMMKAAFFNAAVRHQLILMLMYLFLKA